MRRPGIGSMTRTRFVLFAAGVMFLGFFAALFFVGTPTGRALFAVALLVVVLIAGGNYLSDRGTTANRRSPVRLGAPTAPATAASTGDPGGADPVGPAPDAPPPHEHPPDGAP